MLAQLTDRLPPGPDWLFEVKLDGIRAVGIKDGRAVRLFSRRPRELTTNFPEIVAALAALPSRQLVVDGEIVALDPQGRSSFQLLQRLQQTPHSPPPVVYYLFDLLHEDGHDLTRLPLVERKQRLEQLLQRASPLLRYSAPLEAPPAKLWPRIVELGLEGVIAKRRDSRYEIGRRSGAWLKIKTHHEQEFVIGGYTAPQGTRPYFGSVLVGHYDENRLQFVGRVGTGFNARLLETLYRQFQEYRVASCPFANLPTQRDGRFGQGITAAEMRRCVWLKPVLVCQVRFQEWTRDAQLRQPVFLGLRDDKRAKDVKKSQ